MLGYFRTLIDKFAGRISTMLQKPFCWIKNKTKTCLRESSTVRNHGPKKLTILILALYIHTATFIHSLVKQLRLHKNEQLE